MKWSWSNSEDLALDYLPHRAQVLYLRVLRRRMDFKTGVVGITARLSYQMIAEWLEERPPARSKIRWCDQVLAKFVLRLRHLSVLD